MPEHRYAAGLSSSGARYSLRAYPGRKNPTPETLCASRRFQKRFQKKTGVSGLGGCGALPRSWIGEGLVESFVFEALLGVSASPLTLQRYPEVSRDRHLPF